jgi:hypothetical protein
MPRIRRQPLRGQRHHVAPSAHGRAQRRRLTRRATLLGAGAVLTIVAGVLLATRSTALAANPTPPFTQCPAVGADTSCAILIVIEPDGSLVILHDSTQPPLDGSEDTLVGVQNNSTITATSIAIGSASQRVFGFEGDGLCTHVFVGSGYCQSAPIPPTGYEGPHTSFSNISGDKKRGTVNFTEPNGGLAAGDGTYFSLEGAITPTSLITGAATSLVFTVTSATSSDFADSATVAATLTSAGVAVPDASLTFTLAPGPGSVSCIGTTNLSGVATCSLTPAQLAGSYQITASYVGSSVPFLAPVNATAPFTVTLEQDSLTYTGTSTATIGQPLVLSGAMTTDDPSAGTPLTGKTLRLTLGTGTAAQACTGLTNASGTASCVVIVSASQTVGKVATSATFATDGFYDPAAADSTVRVAAGGVTTPEVGAGGELPVLPASLLVLTGGCAIVAGRWSRSRRERGFSNLELYSK